MFISSDFDFAHKDKDGKCYIIHLYGVCDNYEQIFEKIKRLEFYKKSKEKFVIFLCKHSKKNQPERGEGGDGTNGVYISENRNLNANIFMMNRKSKKFIRFMSRE